MAFVFIFASFIVGTGGQNDTVSVCQDRSTLDTCLQQLPPILEQSELKGIPSSKKDVDASCSAFKKGMKCIDDYSNKCLNHKNRRILEDHVAGARHTFSFLCDDPSFQSEYLRYTQCYRGISKNWDFCADKFLSLVTEELARKNASKESRLVELCCAKHGFQRCVYIAARLKCLKEEAMFIQKIAETLSSTRVYSPYCKSMDAATCSRAAKMISNLHIGYLVYILFLLLT